MNRLNYIVLITLFLTSCNKQEEQETGQVANAVEVTQDLQVQVLPICPLGTPATRTATQPEEGEAIRVSYQPDEVTRSDKTTAEKEIKTAYVVQFNGTAATSTAVWVSGNVATQLKTGSPITCSFSLSSSTKSRVYVVANPKTTPTQGMTLQAFEVVPYTVSTSLPPTGLPMTAYQDVLAGSMFSLFQLKSPLAKLKFTCANGTLTLKGVPSAYYCASAMLPSGAGAVRPSGVTYAATVALTSGTTYYIPANLSGTVSDLSSSIYRYSGKAPANSMYVDIDTDDAVYSVYLGDGSVSDFNVAPNYAYTVTASLLGADPSDLRVMNRNLSVGGTANCYIVTKADTYSFDATVMGNGKTVPAHTQGSVKDDKDFPAITPTRLAPASVAVLWETANTATAPAVGAIVSNVKLNGNRVTFKSGSAQGNAVIAVKNSSGTILWSWHIWRINGQPREFPLAAIGSLTTDGGLVLMDRNLGALSATAQDNLSTGLIYQWGRKDPFPTYAGLTSPNNVAMLTTPSGIPVIPSSEAQYSVAQSIQRPTTFFRYTGDWCSPRTDNLWGTPLTASVEIKGKNYNANKGMKSIYDPCPPGWRVPPAYAFANAAKGSLAFNQGYSLPIGQSGASGWFPASGSRHGYNGALNSVGVYGDYWASTPRVNNLTNGSLLGFSSSNVNPTNSGTRAYGSSCRCYKE